MIHTTEPASTQHAGNAGVFRAVTQSLVCHGLPRTLPDEPMTLLQTWFEEARQRGHYRDHNAMTLATASVDARPAARVVLCHSIEIEPAALVFFCSYSSRKGAEIESNPHAACVFHWPHEHRQARVEGRVERTSDAENDAYFSTQPMLKRIGAQIQSELAPHCTRGESIARALRVEAVSMLGTNRKRPPDWGGYRILAHRVELWSPDNARLHDRAAWELDPDTRCWSARRLGI